MRTKRGKVLDDKLQELEDSFTELSKKFATSVETVEVAHSRLMLLKDQAHVLESRIGVSGKRVAELINRLRQEEVRYHLLERLLDVVASATHEHYHTSNLPDHAGYIIKDSDMEVIRKLLSELGV